MAYVHFIIQNNIDGKFYCELDGANLIYFRSGDYLKLDEGKHLITFDGGMTKWNVQDTLEENDCMTIELMIGYNENCGYKTVIGFPEYRIASLGEDAIKVVEELMANRAEEKALKSAELKKRIIKISLLILSLMFIFGGLVSVLGGLIGEVIFAVIFGVIMAISGLILFFVTKKKTKDK